MISTKNLDHLPDIDALMQLTRSLAMLDAIIKRDWEYRNYSFNSKWDVGEQMASMRNGSGDSWFCLFCQAGAILKGFDHESVMSPWANAHHQVWPGVLDQVPDVFGRFIAAPWFSAEDTTFCIWRQNKDTRWHRGDIKFPTGTENPDGSAWLLSILDGKATTYAEWARDYYERPIGLSNVEHVYAHKRLTDPIVKSLNPETDLRDLAEDIVEIGYPTS